MNPHAFFVGVTRTDGTKTWINLRHIVSIADEETTGGDTVTEILYGNGDIGIQVQESPEQIFAAVDPIGAQLDALTRRAKEPK